MKKRFIPSLLLAALLAGNAQAEIVSDSLRTTIYYRTASARLELPYMDNDRHLAALGDSIRSLGGDPAVVLRRILIQASASPDGNTKYNKELARKRGEDLRDYLKDNLSLPDSIFALQPQGEGWSELAEKLGRTDAPWRDKAIAIIRDTPEWVVREGKVVDGRKRQLMNLAGGRAWQYMKENLFDSLRSGALVVCEMERIERVKPKPESAQAELKPAPEQAVDNVMNPDDTVDTAGKELETTATLYNKEDETIPQDNTNEEMEKRPFYMAVKTNLLYDAALVPNVGLEVYPVEVLMQAVRRYQDTTGRRVSFEYSMVRFMSPVRCSTEVRATSSSTILSPILTASVSSSDCAASAQLMSENVRPRRKRDMMQNEKKEKHPR